MNASIPIGFSLFMAFTGLVFTAIFVVVIVMLVRAAKSTRKLKQEGIDPVTVVPEAFHNLGQMAARDGRSVEERLRELERLRSEGLISAEEYEAQRAEIIKDV